jgi:hypothetical protein
MPRPDDDVGDLEEADHPKQLDEVHESGGVEKFLELEGHRAELELTARYGRLARCSAMRGQGIRRDFTYR